MGKANKILLPILSSWLDLDGDDSDVVMSSRVRIARNLEAVNFPIAGEDELLPERVKGILDADYMLMKMSDLSLLERALLVEKHLISPYLMNKSKFGAVLINEAENSSVMINEEDHLRIQCMEPGLRLFDALERAMHIESEIENEVPFAFNPELGFLTSCVTNVGTGLRASVMVHLPGLVLTKRFNKMAEAIRSVGFVVRGIYGEGSHSLGHIFQISNQVTLGKTEEEIVMDLTQMMEQVIMQERVCRTHLKQKFHITLEDRVFRSFGLLKHARILTMLESLNAISDLHLGMELGVFEHITRQKINELILFSKPAFLRRAAGQDMLELEEKVIRASVIRDILQDV